MLAAVGVLVVLAIASPGGAASGAQGAAAWGDATGIGALIGGDARFAREALLGPSRWVERVGGNALLWPWWAMAGLCAVAAWRRPETATMAAGLLVAGGNLDFGVAAFGLLIGRAVRGRELPAQRRDGWWWVRTVGWSAVSLTLAGVMGTVLLALGAEAGGWLVVPGFFVGVLGLRLVRHAWTRLGRARIAAAWARATNHEWWPSWVLYAPTVASLPIFMVRGRGVLAFTACNPGIEGGGGFVGESKSAIMAKLPAGDARVLATVLIGPGGAERAAGVLRRMEEDAALGGYPVVIKPDAGQRGVGVTLARTPYELGAYLAAHPGAAVLQRYHAGPREAGIFWMRKTAAEDCRPIGERDGSISSVTLKEFQWLEGDGRRSVRRLIIDHPRYRCQMRVFFARFADRLDEVPAAGERVALSFAGNHAQGTRFAEGGHLATTELNAAINTLARAFEGGGLDYGRFDVRYTSDEALALGEGFAVLEVNGTTSEPTNIYDPAHSAVFAWRTLRRHWAEMYRIGRERVREGGEAMPPGRFLRMIVGGKDAGRRR